MADPIVGATIQILLEKAVSLVTTGMGLAFGFKDELENLKESMEMIQALLADADSRQSHDKAVQLWLKRLEGVAFDADHALDELHYETLRRRVVKYGNGQLKQSEVCFFFSFSYTKIAFRWRMASKVRDINMKLNKINQEANALRLNIRYQIDAAFSSTTLPAAAGATTSRQTDSILVPNVVGRVDKESEIIDMLLSPSEKVLSVIPITGAGGLGKTTLAKSVYNNPKIDGHFGPKIWVCVAKEQIKIMELFKLILVQLTEEEVKVDDRNVIVKKIGEKLQSKKYFLVLDDVWDHEQGLWNDYFNTLIGLNETKGSWCLVTTRSERVAIAVSRQLEMNGGPCFLEKLSDDECWSILKKLVVAGEEVPKELEALKGQILRKCDGLPLAAKLIGGLLVNKGKEEWESIMKEISYSNEYQDQIKPILKVSLDHLSPASIKKCFAYCSIFPQDTKFKQDVLIQFWMAESFVQPDPQNQRLMEEIGGDYLRTLLQIALLEKDEDAWGTYYKMHDLVHDFAKLVLNPEISNQDSYLALNSSEEMAEIVKRNKSASVRTLFLHLESGIPTDLLSRFKHLHVLKLSGDDVKFLPSSIDQLIHLRLLDISSSGIERLTKSLCKLYNLQTLTMSSDSLEGGFPERMSNLISLRHLNYYDDRYAEFKMPTQIAQLTCLQTLRFFNVSQEKGCGIEELGTLKYLKGSLEIRNLELVKSKEAAKQAKLSEKPNLSRLEFSWDGIYDQKSYNYDEDVLEGLQPHQNLQELEIHYFPGNKFPQWFMNLSELVKLRIERCERCSELPTLGQLPSLKHLYLSRLDNIQFVGDEFYGITDEKEEGRPRGPGSNTRRQKFFPALEKLRVKDMKNLVEWKDADRSTINEAEFDVLPILRKFTISDCPQLTTLPCLSKILKVKNCPKLTSLINGTSLDVLMLWDCNNLRELPEGLFGSSLQDLRIYRCANLISLGVNGQKCPLPCLEKFTIEHCNELTTIPDKIFDSCTSLQYLSVLSCPNLERFSLNLQEMPSLKKSMLVNCPKLIPQRFKGFASATRLRELWISPFYDSSIDDFDWSGLISAPALRVLELQGLPHTDSLPRQLQYLTSLTSLTLWEFGGIEVLPDWIGDLVSLEVLCLSDCEKLRSLPSETAMRRLTKFTYLHVYGCPLLRQRYTPQRGIYYLEEEISRDPASSEQKSINSAKTSASHCFPLLLKKKSSGAC